MGNYPNVTVEWVPGWTPEVTFYDDADKEIERMRIVHMTFSNLQELLKAKGFVHKPKAQPAGGATDGINPQIGTLAWKNMIQSGHFQLPGRKHPGVSHGQAGLVQPGQAHGQAHVIDPVKMHGQHLGHGIFPSHGSHSARMAGTANANQGLTDPSTFPSRGSHPSSVFAENQEMGAGGGHPAAIKHLRGGRRMSEHVSVRSSYDRLKHTGMLDGEGQPLGKDRPTLDRPVDAADQHMAGGVPAKLEMRNVQLPMTTLAGGRAQHLTAVQPDSKVAAVRPELQAEEDHAVQTATA